MHFKMMLFAGQNIVEFGSANYSPNAFVPVTPYSNYVSETIFFEDDPVDRQQLQDEVRRPLDRHDQLSADYANITSRVARAIRRIRSAPT